MAATTTNRALTQYSGDTPSNLFLRPYIEDWMPKLRRTDTPLSKLIKVTSQPKVPALKLEWGWGSVTPDQDSLSGSVNNSVTAIPVTNEGMWAINDTFMIDSEIFYVTAKPGSGNLTVTTRGFAGSTAASHSSGATLIKMLPAYIENADTQLSPITQGETDYNYFQQAEFAIQLSHRRQVTPTYESLALNLNDAEKAEMRKKMEQEAPVYLENALLFGWRSLGSTTVPSTMGGLLNTPSFVTTSNTSLGGVPLTEFTLMDNLQTVYNLVGQDKMGHTLMAHPFVLRAISSWYNASRRTTGTDDSIKLSFTKIDTGWFGELKLYPNYKMVKSGTSGAVALDKLIVFEPSDLERKPYAGDSGWHLDALPENGWYTKAALRGDWTLEAQNPDSRLILGGFSTTASDYPGLA